jgi:glycosyltransferase involved in cell wall biosynthesis
MGHLPPDQVHEQLRGAAFLVMPSECYESFGMVIIEAFAHGIPVVASDLGAMAEIVDDGKTGLLFPSGRPRALAAVASRLVDDPDERRRMGVLARAEFEERYTLERGYERLIGIYEEVIAGERTEDAA